MIVEVETEICHVILSKLLSAANGSRKINKNLPHDLLGSDKSEINLDLIACEVR